MGTIENPNVNDSTVICHDCAAKQGWKLPNGYVVTCIKGKCPECGNIRYLIDKEEYRRFGIKTSKRCK